MQEENKNEEIQNDGGMEGKEEGKFEKIIKHFQMKKQGEESAEIFQGDENENVILKLAAIFIVAVLVGVVVKTQAAKTVIIGFDDYRISELQSEFDLKKEKEAIPAQGQQQEQEGAAPTESPEEVPAPSQVVKDDESVVK